MSNVWEKYPNDTLAVDVSRNVVQLIEENGFDVRPARATDGRLGLKFVEKLAAEALCKLESVLAGSGVDFNATWVFMFITK